MAAECHRRGANAVTHLYVFCEGATERQFCVQVLQPHLFMPGTGMVHTLAVGEKDHHHIYGLGKRARYDRVRRFITNTIKQRENENVYFATMFDLYALAADFPGTADLTRNPANPTPYVESLEQALESDIDHRFFFPHILLHEFETLLFSQPEAFAIAFENCDAIIDRLKQIAARESSVEHIDDGQHSAPSKRIISVLPQYEGRKSTAGPDIAEYIGLDKIRQKCPHFDKWLQQVESAIRTT